MASRVTESSPRSNASFSAASLSARRVSSFLRSRSPVMSQPYQILHGGQLCLSSNEISTPNPTKWRVLLALLRPFVSLGAKGINRYGSLAGAQRIDRPCDEQHGRADGGRRDEVDALAAHHQQTGPIIGKGKPQHGRDGHPDAENDRTAPPVGGDHQDERRQEEQADHEDRPLSAKYPAGELCNGHVARSASSTTLTNRNARVNRPTPPGFGDT